MRRLTGAVTSAILLLALLAGNSISPTKSVAASEVPCLATATGRIVNSAGSAISGDVFFQVVAENLGTSYLSNYKYVENNSASAFQLCFDAELDQSLHSEDGIPNAPQYAPDLWFAEGDVIRIAVNVAPQDGAATYQEISITSGQATALNSGTRSINLGDIQVSSQSQIAMSIKNESDVVVANAQWQIGKSYQSDGGRYIENLMLMGVTDSSGRINAAGLPDGDYGMNINGPWDSTLGYVGRAYFFSIVGGSITWLSSTDETPLTLSHLVLPIGNLRLDVRMPNGDPLTLEESFGLSSNIERTDPWKFYESQAHPGGIIALVDEGQTYQVEVSVNSSEGALSKLLGGTYEVSVTNSGTTVVGTQSNVINLKEANLTLSSSSVGGASSATDTYLVAATGSCVELTLQCFNSVEEDRVSAGIAWRQGVNGETSFVLPVPNAGSSQDYWAVIDPTGEFKGVSKTSRKLTATNVGDTISFSSDSGISWVGTKGTVAMEAPNFNVVTYATNLDGSRGNPLKSIRVSTNRSEEEGNDSIWHYFNASTNVQGESGGLLLEDSRYFVYIEATSDRVAKTASPVSFEVSFDNGEISLPNLPTYLESSVQVNADGTLEVNLPRPNVIGTVVTPEGDKDPYANVDFERQNCLSDDCYKSFRADAQGIFAGFLSPGLYLAKTDPSWRSQDEFARNVTEFLVEPTGSMCSGSNIDRTETPNTCFTDQKSNLEFSLAVPNLSGVVMAGLDNVNNNGGIRIEKFKPNSSEFDYTRMLWANVDSTGQYKVNIQESGSYQLVFDAVDGLDGYTATKVYFVVSGNSDDGFEFCQASKPIGNKNPVCPSTTIATAAPFILDVNLGRSNLTMKAIEDGVDSFDWAYGWVQQLSSGLGATTEFINFNFSKITKKAYLNLGEVGSVKKYKLNIDFGKQDGSSVKKNLVLWAANFDNNEETIEFCLDKHFFAGAAQVSPLCRDINSDSAWISGLQTLDVDTSPGVFRGVVSTPEEEPRKVRFAQVQAMKWEESNWGTDQGWWQWTDNYSSTDREGRYSLDITAPGVYLIEARTPWGSNAYSFAPGTNIIKVTNPTGDDPAICEYTKIPKNWDAFNFDFGTCSPIAPSGSGIDTRFKRPNLVGTVSWAGKATSDAWVNAYALETVDCGDSCSYVSRTWISLQMNDSGKFFGSLPQGSYEVEAHPNNRLSGVAVKAKIAFTVDEEGVLKQGESTLGEINISLAEPNVRGTVCTMGSTNPCVPAEWTHIGISDTSDWSYNYANTNEEGEFSLLLEVGEEYQFRLYPSDSLRQGTGKTSNVEVLDGETSETPLCTIDGGSPIDCSNLLIALSAPNVKGTMVYEVVAGQQTPTPWAWINVWRYTENDSFWTGASTNSFGEFALTLPKENTPGEPRIYNATAYFYGMDEQRAPLDFQIRGEYVAGINPAPSTTKFTWKYLNEDSWREIPVAGMTPNFDFVQPNSRVTLVGVPNNGKRAIRIVSDTDNSSRIFRVTTSGGASSNFAEVNLPTGDLATVLVIPEVGEEFVCSTSSITPVYDPGDGQTEITIDVRESCEE
jgi:hypothetical protein